MRTPHTTAMLIPLAAALVLAAAGSAAAQKNKCTDWPLEVSISSGGVLGYDTKGTPYKNGVDGVSNTVVHICSGSYDATVGLNGSRRYMGFDFSSFMEDSTASWPTWADDQFLTKPFLNVRNVLWGRGNVDADPVTGTHTFETRMTIGYIRAPGDRSDYVLRFFPTVVSPGPDVTPAAPPFDDNTVPVTVVDDPTTCTWTVTVKSDYVGGLYKTSTNAFAGHYHMPFQLTLKANSCPM